MYTGNSQIICIPYRNIKIYQQALISQEKQDVM